MRVAGILGRLGWQVAHHRLDILIVASKADILRFAAIAYLKELGIGNKNTKRGGNR